MNSPMPTYKWEESEKEPLPPLVRIEWHDAAAWAHWTPLEIAAQRAPDPATTVGYLLSWDEKCVVTASTVSKSPDGDGWEVTCVFTIPSVWVDKLIRLETVGV